MPLKVRPEEPVGPARSGAGWQNVILKSAIADRNLGPGVEVRAAPRDHDHPGVASAVRDDRRGRLDDCAARRALDVLSRQASERPLHLTREAFLPHRAARLDFRVYKLAARIVG